MAKAIVLGPTRGLHQPDYELRFYRDGDPKKRIRGVNLRSVTAIQTSKSINDLSGTFTVTLKDAAARWRIREMDAGTIRLRGHYRPDLITVLKVVVDEVRPGGSADVYAAAEDTVITGRCVGKYLQTTSLFLPVWDPEAGLPTALIFGLGDAAKKVGGNRPYDIFRYLVRRYTYGQAVKSGRKYQRSEVAGTSGVPNSRFWLNAHTRFSKKVGLQIPFLQFDENSMAEALKRLEVLGFTEAWVDELGRVVYRHPPWDAPVKYSIPTSELVNWSFPKGDVEAATYVEVIPAGDPGIDSATAQALRAGRAPVPSSYLRGATTLRDSVSKGFVIQTDRKGKPTAKGRKNHWYRLQRRLGVRPQQVTSPLLFTQQQAQRQAEGLLRFYARATKGMQITIPGAPEVRLGYTARVHGELERRDFDRTFYIEAVSHDYVETNDGGQYTTTILGSHGRDKWDPGFTQMVLPRFDPADLANDSSGGVLEIWPNNGPASSRRPAKVGYPLSRHGTIGGGPGVGTHSFTAWPNNWQSDNAVDIMVPEGTPVFAVDDGVISSSLGFGLMGSSSSRFGGRRLHLETSDNVWYYAHLRSYAPKIGPGAKIRRGQLLGTSGTANRAPHLHLACQHGNPKTLLGL